MKIIGLTGGIGSGKSIVAMVFKNLGIPVYNSDIEAKKLNNESKIIIDGLKERFGEEIYINNLLAKRKLADLIFNNKENLEFVNSLIHPVVKEHFCNWLNNQEAAFVIKESAILFEAGINNDVDKIISVTAPKDVRIERIQKRDQLSLIEIEARMSNQIKDKERYERSDFIINNNEQLILPQILEIYNIFKNTSV